MGGQISCIHPNYHVDNQSRYAAQTVKLIRSDGMVKVYHRPVDAAELMLEFPKHLVCHADSFFIGQKVPPLSEKDRLQLGNKYFLLPRQFFQSVLSFVTIASFVLVDDNSDTASSKKKEFVKKLAATCKPFDILKSASGNLQIQVSDEFITKLMEEGRLREGGEEDNRSCNDQVCTTPQLKKDYSQLVGFRRSVQWRPKLDTIREKKDRKKIGGFGIKKKKKMKTQAKIDQQKTRKLEKEKEKKEKKMEKKEKREKKKEQKSEKKKEKKKEKEEKEIRKKEKTASKVPPPPPPLPPPPPIRSSSLKFRWKKKKL